MERFPFLDTVALIVIGLLGLKLCVSFAAPYLGGEIQRHIDGRTTDLYFSLITVSIFTLPILSSLLLNFPKSAKN
jgi:uncharacterized membrane protein SpoIIM required for sporulation